MTLQDQRFVFLEQVESEYARALAKHPPLHSAHEGYGVLMEEVREFEAEVFKRKRDRNPDAMKQELVQIAAVCARCFCELDMRAGS